MFKDYKDIVTVEEMSEMLRIGRNSAYNLIKNGCIRYLKNGRSILIPKIYIIEYVSESCSQTDENMVQYDRSVVCDRHIEKEVSDYDG